MTGEYDELWLIHAKEGQLVPDLHVLVEYPFRPSPTVLLWRGRRFHFCEPLAFEHDGMRGGICPHAGIAYLRTSEGYWAFPAHRAS